MARGPGSTVSIRPRICIPRIASFRGAPPMSSPGSPRSSRPDSNSDRSQSLLENRSSDAAGSEAGRQVVVHDTDGLEKRVDDRRAYEGEAAGLQVLADRVGKLR